MRDHAKIDGHPPCNFYCTSGEHADVAHWEAQGWTDAEVRRAWERHGVRVTRIVAATEAPRRADGAPGRLVYWVGGRGR